MFGWLAVCSSACLAKTLNGANFNVGHYMQTSQLNFFIHATLKGTIDFYHFISFHWPWPYTRLVQSKKYWLHFLADFSSNGDDIWLRDGAVQAEHSETAVEEDLLKQGKEILFFQIASKNVGMRLDVLSTDLIEIWYDDRYYCTLYFHTRLILLHS